jgi:hypothetical protein
MKKNLLFLIAFVPAFVLAQTPVTDAAGYGTTSPSSACLSCPGATWNNEMNITALDGSPSDVGLENYGFCFQSSCFYSRYLHARQFGFAVPGTASILGIEVNIVRSAPAAGIIRDTILNIMQSLSSIGTDRSAAGYWPATYTSQVYGGPTDLWGLTWTPADVNAPSMTLQLKIANTDSSSVTGINVDFVSMTVYYSTATGIVESQTAVPNSFSAYQSNSNEISVGFNTLTVGGDAKIEVYDLSGKLVASKAIGVLNPGEHHEIISVSMRKGLYLVRLWDGNKMVSKKVLVD